MNDKYETITSYLLIGISLIVTILIVSEVGNAIISYPSLGG